jgi:hypothetical protein
MLQAGGGEARIGPVADQFQQALGRRRQVRRRQEAFF